MTDTVAPSVLARTTFDAKRQKHKRFTSGEMATMRALREQGLTLQKIAEAVGAANPSCVGNAIRPGTRERLVQTTLAWKEANQEKYAANIGRAKRATRRAIAALKLSVGCMDCGYREHPQALEFDHRPGEEKLFEIAPNSNARWIHVLAEIAKCDVVCANCHRVRSARRAGKLEVIGQLALF